MSSRKKIMLMFAVALSLLFVSILANLYFSKLRHEKIRESERESKQYSVDIALQQSGANLRMIAKDNSLWDELVSFIYKYDSAWASSNINTLLTSTDVRYVWIYNEKEEPIHRLTANGYKKIQHPIDVGQCELAVSKTFENNKRFCHFYMLNDTSIIEVAGATIHNTNDVDRKETPKGYFFIGRVFGKKELNDLEIITNSRVTLSRDTTFKIIPNEFQMLIIKKLYDWKGNSIADIHFISEDKIAQAEDEYSKISLAVYVLFMVLVVLIAYWMINKVISQPLNKIVKGLNTESDEPIKELLEKNDEFGQIARLMKKSIDQKDEIENQYKKITYQNEELEELNATKDKFFSIIAHDLRNPFGVILASTEFIANPNYELTREEIVDFSNDINNTAKMLFNLLENLLTWARSQRGTIQFEPIPLDLLELSQTTKFVLDPQAEAKSISIALDIPEKIECFGDRNMVLTIIRNLTSNAIKFTNIGGTVRISAKDYDDDFIEAAVSDNGVGISKDNLAKLFRIDVNLTTAGTSQEQGTGLGLILCQEFIEKHGGNIRVESELGQGTTFFFTLPKKEIKKYRLVNTIK